MPTRKPGFDDGNRLVTRFGNVDDMDNDASYRLGDGDVAGFGTEDNKNKYRYGGAAPFILTVTDVNESEDVANPNPNSASIGYELQTNGSAFWLEQADSSGGPANFNQVNPGVDWIDDKSNLIGGLYHARMTQNSGDTLDQSSGLNTWIDLISGGGFIYVLAFDSDGTYTFDGTVDISDDGGSTIIDTASIILELIIQP